MIRALFALTLVVALLVNIAFLFAARDKPPDPPPIANQQAAHADAAPRHLSLRSDDFYQDQDPVEPAAEGARQDGWPANEPIGRRVETHERRFVPDPRINGSHEEDRKQMPSVNKSIAANRPASNDLRQDEATIQAPPRELAMEIANGPAQANGNKSNSSHLSASDNINNGASETQMDNRISVRVKSSKEHVYVSVNNLVIYESAPARPLSAHGTAQELEPNDGRGIHVVVLSQFDGSMMASRLFDTYSPNQDEELSHFLGMIREGRILVFAVKDEASFRMAAGSSARLLLQALGSRQIARLGWRDTWAMVVTKSSGLESSTALGQPSRAHEPAGEALAKAAKFGDWAPAVELDARLSLTHRPPEDRCPWERGHSDEDQRRRAFCDRLEGYGQLCDCHAPAQITFNPQKIEGSQLANVPILVMASNRPYYLYRMLRSLLATQGLNQSAVSVFIDGFYEEPLQVARLFKLRAIQQKPRGSRSGRISHHYKSSLAAAFQLFPEASHAIIFEEDLDVANDALVYFNQTIGLLRRDPSLYCVSAWNDQGYEHTARDTSLVYRIETMPGLGWMLSRELFQQELEPRWPSQELAHDWDMWIRTEAVRRGRECLIPDISRTFHFGSLGTNINSYFQRQYFSKHAFNLLDGGTKFGPKLDELTQEAYERHIERLVRQARPVKSTGNHANATQFLCSMANQLAAGASSYDNLLDQRRRNGAANASSTLESDTNVIFIEMIDRHDFSNWLKLAKCWRIWDLDARGQHNSMWRLFLDGRHTLVIGSPASPYAKLKPRDLEPFRLL